MFEKLGELPPKMSSGSNPVEGLIKSIIEGNDKDKLWALAQICEDSVLGDAKLFTVASKRLSRVVADSGEFSEAVTEETQLLLMMNTSSGYLRNGEYDKAQAVMESCLERIKRNDVKDDNIRTNVSNILGDCYFRKNDYNNAEKMYTLALKGQIKKYGKASSEAFLIMESLGLVYKEKGDMNKALVNLKECLEWYKNVPEPESSRERSNEINTMNNIAGIYVKKEEWDKAFELLSQVYEWRKNTLGETHVTTLAGLNNLALVYEELGDPNKAIEMRTKAVEGFKRSVGEDHPNYLTALVGIGSIYGKRGEHVKALKVFEPALEGRKNTLGEYHVDTLAVMHPMGNSYLQIAEFAKALEMWKQCYEGRKKTLGQSHPDTVKSKTVLDNLIGVLKKHGRTDLLK
jgi:tetratricopeptide (TPR) repeat protein